MNEKLEDADFVVSIVSVCNALGPFYLKDPAQDACVLPLYRTVGALDVDDAELEWPFVNADCARRCLGMMQNGLDAGVPGQDVVDAYRRLMVGPGHLQAPPWGSVYTDHDQVIFGESTLALRQWMRQQGIDRLGDEATPEDQFGLMLMLLGWIVQHKPEATEEYLQDHLLTWSSHYLAILAEAADQPFFEGLAKLTAETLEGLQAQLDIEVVYPRFYR